VTQTAYPFGSPPTHGLSKLEMTMAPRAHPPAAPGRPLARGRAGRRMGATRALPLLLLLACGPGWTTLQQSGPPSSLRGAQALVVAFDYDELRIGQIPAGSYLATLEPPERAELQRVLQAMADGFLAQLTLELPFRVEPSTGPPNAGEVLVTARFRAVELGSYQVNRRIDSQLVTDLTWTVDGRVTDVIRTRTRVQTSSSRPTRLGRMQVAAEKTAGIAADFFWAEQQR